MATPAASRPNRKASGRGYRRATALVADWQDDQVRFRNYLVGSELTTSSSAAALLFRLPARITPARYRRLISPSPGLEELFQAALQASVFLHLGSDADSSDCAWARAWPWGVEAGLYHFATRHVEFMAPEAERAALAQLAARSPPRSPYKRSPGLLTRLPAPEDLPSELGATLLARRTHRRFSRRRLSLQTLSTLLHWVWGRSLEGRDPILGRFVLKTSPSAGARHPTEVYVLPRRVGGLPASVYHYDVKAHGLRKVGERVSTNAIVHAMGDQPWVGEAAATFVMTSLVERTAWKYAHPHAYRVLFLDAGHLGQTFHLVATALGLAPFTSAALHAQRVERMVAVDGLKELPIYAACVGYPED